MGESLTDVEEEESLEPELPTVETNPKNPIRRAEQERGVQFVLKAVVLRTSSSRTVEGRRERTNKAIHVCVFLCRHVSNSSLSRQVSLCKFPILIRRDDGHGQTGVTRYARKDPTPYLSPSLVDWSCILKDRNELGMTVFRE